MDATIATITIVLLLTVLWYLKNYVQARGLPPEAPGALPIIGHLLKLNTSKMHIQFAEWGKTISPIFRVHVGPFETMYVITGYDLIKEVLLKQGERFGYRPVSAQGSQVLSTDKGISSASGERWKEQHRYTLSVLKDFGFGRAKMENAISEEVSKMIEFIDKSLGSRKLAVVDVNIPIKRAVGNVVATIALGRCYDIDDKEFIQLQDTLDRMLMLTVSEGVGFLNAFPFMQYVPFLSKWLQMEELVQTSTVLQQYLYRVMKEHLPDLDVHKEPDEFMEAYLQTLKKRRDNKEDMGYFSEEQLLTIVADLWAAGIETVGGTLRWIILYLMHFPDVQQKCFEEIKKIVGLNRKTTLDDRNQMHYMLAMINEAQRHSSVADSAIFHTCIEDSMLGGYRIPANSILMPFMNAVHIDPEYFPHPDRFDPDRFIDENGKFRKDEHVIPFGMGKRVCIGESMARMELFLFTTGLLQQFEFRCAPGVPKPTLEGLRGFSVVPVPYDCEVVRRVP